MIMSMASRRFRWQLFAVLVTPPPTFVLVNERTQVPTAGELRRVGPPTHINCEVLNLIMDKAGVFAPGRKPD